MFSPSSYNFPTLLLAVGSLFVLSLPGCNSQYYQLIVERLLPGDPVFLNTVRLQCRDQADLNNLPVEDAMFWVGNTTRDLRDLLREEGISSQNIGIDRFQFTITRSLEGRYFCGPDIFQTSPMLQLIGEFKVTTSAVVEDLIATQAKFKLCRAAHISPESKQSNTVELRCKHGPAASVNAGVSFCRA